MIDWLTIVIPIKHFPFNTGTIVSMDKHGCIEWEICKKFVAQGSYETNIQLKSQGDVLEDGFMSELYLSGNPSKFLLGHNVYGTENLFVLVGNVIQRLFNESGRQICPDDWQRIVRGDYEIKTIDINRAYDVSTNTNVKQWLSSASVQTRTRHGTPTTRGGTVYWGKNSRRWSVKAYNKLEEIKSRNKKHQLSHSIDSDLRERIINWCVGKLRLELRLHSKELQENELNKASTLTESRINELFNEYIGKLEMSHQTRLNAELIESLPKAVRGTYALWKDGYNIQDSMSKASYYRHKKILLKYDVDISLPAPEKETANIIPLVKVIEAVPAETPDFASDLNKHNAILVPIAV